MKPHEVLIIILLSGLAMVYIAKHDGEGLCAQGSVRAQMSCTPIIADGSDPMPFCRKVKTCPK